MDVAKRIGTHNEILIRVDSLAGTNQSVPITGLGIGFVITTRRVRSSAKVVRNKNRVVTRFIQGAVGLVTDFDVF